GRGGGGCDVAHGGQARRTARHRAPLGRRDDRAGFDALALHWDVLGEEARVHGKTVDRSKWRLVGPMHCAETKEQAIADVQYGIEHWFRYFQAVAAFPQMAVLGDSAVEMIDFINKSGLGVIGTPEECAAQIDRLVKQS